MFIPTVYCIWCGIYGAISTVGVRDYLYIEWKGIGKEKGFLDFVVFFTLKILFYSFCKYLAAVKVLQVYILITRPL